MYKRDVAIVLLSCVAILVSLQHEGSFSFRKAWYHHTVLDASDTLIAQHHELPPPIVADLNGDGHLEMIIATPDLQVQVVQPKPAGRAGEGFAAATPITAVSLLYKRTLLAAGRKPVAMAVGYIDPLPRERVRPPRKQVVAVVTASWQVVVFDHNLKLLWEYDAKQHFPAHSHIKEVSVLITPHQVNPSDRGLIVVGASVQRGDLASGEGLETSSPSSDAGGASGDAGGASQGRRLMAAGQGQQGQGGFSDDDVLLREMQEEAEETSHSRSAAANATLQDLDRDDPVSGVDLSRHFSYMALEGGRGAARWHHSSADFHKDLDALAQELRPQNDFRLEAEKLEGRHYGEASCRDYRASLLHVLPHLWRRPADTRLEEAHFVKHKAVHGARKETLAAGGHAAHKSAQGAGHKASTVVPRGALSSLVGGGSGRHPAPGTHSTGGHKGASVGQHGAGLGGAKGLHLQHHTSNVTANALVAFLEEGIEVVHLFTGRTLCKLHLLPNVLHADMNGDGVIDHIAVRQSASVDAQTDGAAADGVISRAKACMAVVTSGIPPRDVLFQVPVCKSHKFGLAKGIFSRSAQIGHAVEVLPPALLPVPDLQGRYGGVLHGRHGILVFATNKGEMTAVSARGEHLWQAFFGARWPSSGVATALGGQTTVVPTLTAMALRKDAVPTAVLAGGSSVAVIVSEHGRLLDQLLLPAPPVQSLLVMDFNGDGLNDVVAVTANGVYGFAQVQHLGGFTLSSLLLTLIIGMGIVYYTQQFDSGGVAPGGAAKSRKLRSTDYVD